MYGLFEYSDTLQAPYEAFVEDETKHVWPIKPHWHYFAELLYVTEGSINVTINNVSYTANVGDLIVFFPRAIHSIALTDDPNIHYTVLKFDMNWLNFSNSYTPRLSSLFSVAEKSVSGYFPAKCIEGLNLGVIFEDCVNEYSTKEYGYDLIINSKITYLLVTLLRIWRTNGLDTDKIVLEKEEDSTIYNITEYIDAHSNELLNVQELAKMCNMSYSYFAREFKRLHGRSCKEYIEFIKTCKVENMLLFTDFDLNYISQETGFSDNSHLIKNFKKHKGITPKQFKKLHLGDK